MTQVSYSSSSFYSATPQTSWYLDLLVLKDIRRDATDQLVTIESKYENRPWLMAWDQYGDSNYWWAIVLLNLDQIRDPIYDFTSGKQIYIPTRDRLMNTLSVSS